MQKPLEWGMQPTSVKDHLNEIEYHCHSSTHRRMHSEQITLMFPYRCLQQDAKTRLEIYIDIRPDVSRETSGRI